MIRLANGSVVAVQDSVELGVFDNFPRKPDSKLSRQSLAINLRLSQESLAAGSRTLDETTMPCEFFYPGQVVSTKKANLRLGSWIIGSYDASHKANGIVVGVRVISINIEWVTSNVFDMSRTSASPPPNQLQSTALDEVRLYNKNCLPRNAANPSSVFGSRQGHDMVVGDYVKFRDITGATLKYSEQSHLTAQNGVFRRIPRIITQGFDMNVFRIRETTSKARIQWQDGSITEHDATKLIPDINFDEHEVWPGEICSLKSTETLEEGVRVLGTVGVVQTCNARERLASIRWFRSPNAAVFEDQDSVLVPGSLLGELTDHETMVSFYDISSYPALTKMRGDLVLISPNPTLLAMHNALVLKEASTRTTDVPSMGDFSDRYNDPTVFTDDPQNIGAADGGVSWFGEIVDLGTDGLLTVRLGALDKVRDIKVSVERVITAIGGDHEGFGSDSDSEPTSDEDESDWSDSDSDDLKVIEEVVEYEGGQRLDNGGEDVWMTDDSGDEDDSDEDSKPQLPQSDARHAMEEIEDTCAEDIQSPAVPNNPTSTLPRRSVEHHEEYQFANLQNMPVQFEVLDEEVAVDHRYLHKSPRLSAKLLRRIRKEHSILENSLPTGIWVRTWADRLDLMRILIVGPRGTPYELAPFMLDLHFKDDFPESPPIVFFHSWTHGVGRINPNLYEDGNVCLSILGTWPGDSKGEGWTPEKSSVLQIIVSLLGLVLVAEPYFSKFSTFHISTEKSSTRCCH